MENETENVPKTKVKRKSKGMRKHIRRMKQEQRKDHMPPTTKKRSEGQDTNPSL